MPQLRVALAQVNLTVGAIDGNAEEILRWSQHAAERGAHLIAFPEMALTGYPIEDLALRPSFVEASRTAMDRLASRLAEAGLGELAVVVGYLDRDCDAVEIAGQPKGAPQNCVAVCHRGEVVARSAKHHLPNYGVFDEFRYFLPGSVLPVVKVHGVDVAITVCEDLWQDGGPVAAARAAGAGLLLVINGSPYEHRKDDIRLDLVQRRAKQAMCHLAYVNLVGAQDELVFDGDSILVDSSGDVIARAPQFSEGLLAVDLEVHGSPLGVDDYAGIRIQRTTVTADPVPAYQPARAGVAPRLPEAEQVYQAVTAGVRDYVQKSGFSGSVVVGLSGGIDSALTAAVACDAIGAANVYGISNPSPYSSEHSKDDAAELAKRTGLNFRSVPIEPMMRAFHGELELTGVAEENLQARIRGMIWMSVANQEGHLVLAAGNKSELATGYSTMYGDAVGAYAPLKDVPKTWVFELAKWRNAAAAERGETPPIPENSISKPPSAELRPGQLDTDSLPPYEVLDDILDDYIEADASAAQIVAAGFDPELVERVIGLVDRAEYKRRQYPPGPKISFRAFGRDRRLPLTNAWREPGVPAGPAAGGPRHAATPDG